MNHEALRDEMALQGTILEAFFRDRTEWGGVCYSEALPLTAMSGDRHLVLTRKYGVGFCEEFDRWLAILTGQGAMPALEASIARFPEIGGGVIDLTSDDEDEGRTGQRSAVASGASGGLPNMYYIVFWGQVCVRNQYGAGSLMKNIAIAYGL